MPPVGSFQIWAPTSFFSLWVGSWSKLEGGKDQRGTKKKRKVWEIESLLRRHLQKKSLTWGNNSGGKRRRVRKTNLPGRTIVLIKDERKNCSGLRNLVKLFWREINVTVDRNLRQYKKQFVPLWDSTLNCTLLFPPPFWSLKPPLLSPPLQAGISDGSLFREYLHKCPPLPRAYIFAPMYGHS